MSLLLFAICYWLCSSLCAVVALFISSALAPTKNPFPVNPVTPVTPVKS